MKKNMCVCIIGDSFLAQSVKNLPANGRKCRFDPWVGKIPRGGHGHPLQYSCLESPMDREDLQTTVHGVVKNQTQLREIYSSLCSSYRFAHDCTMDRGAGRLQSTGLHRVRHDGCSLARMHLPDQPHLYRRND